MSIPLCRSSSRLLGLAIAGCLSVALPSTTVRAADPAKPDATPAAKTDSNPATERPAGQMLQPMRERLDQLNLTADQKTKIDAIFASVTAEVQKVRDDATGDPTERAQKVRDIVTGIKGKVADVLDDAQKQKAQELFARPGAAAGGGAARPMAGLMENLQKLDLSDDQKAKVKTLLEDFKKKIEAARTEAQNGGNREAAREKLQTVGQELRTQLMEILTDEQKAKLKTLTAESRAAKPADQPKTPAK